MARVSGVEKIQVAILVVVEAQHGFSRSDQRDSGSGCDFRHGAGIVSPETHGVIHKKVSAGYDGIRPVLPVVHREVEIAVVVVVQEQCRPAPAPVAVLEVVEALQTRLDAAEIPYEEACTLVLLNTGQF